MENPKPGQREPEPPKKSTMPDLMQKIVSKVPEEGAAKAAAIVARSFYREMKKSGFSDNQVINVATELISCLNKSLKGYQERKQEESK